MIMVNIRKLVVASAAVVLFLWVVKYIMLLGWPTPRALIRQHQRARADQEQWKQHLRDHPEHNHSH